MDDDDPPPLASPNTSGLNKWRAKQAKVNEARAFGVGRPIASPDTEPLVTASPPRCDDELVPPAHTSCAATVYGPQAPPPLSSSPQVQRSSFAPADLAVVVVGESGAGKSTFLNYVANYFLGGSPSALQVIIGSRLHAANVGGAQQTEMASHDQSVSQTQESQQYVFGRFVFVDTPGLNDTRGVGNDVTNMQLILDAVTRFRTIAALVVVINGSLARFTSSLQLVLTMLASNLPASALGNVFVLLTHCSPLTCNFDAEAAATALGLEGQRLAVGERVFHMQNSAFNRESAVHDADWDDAMETVHRMTQQIELRTTPVKSSDFLLVRSFRQQLETALSSVLENYRVLAAMPSDASAARALLERQIAANIASIDDTCTVLAGLCPKFTFAEELRLRFDKVIAMRNAPCDENERVACQAFLDAFRQLICKYVPEFRQKLAELPSAPPPTIPAVPPAAPSAPVAAVTPTGRAARPKSIIGASRLSSSDPGSSSPPSSPPASPPQVTRTLSAVIVVTRNTAGTQARPRSVSGLMTAVQAPRKRASSETRNDLIIGGATLGGTVAAIGGGIAGGIAGTLVAGPLGLVGTWQARYNTAPCSSGRGVALADAPSDTSRGVGEMQLVEPWEPWWPAREAQPSAVCRASRRVPRRTAPATSARRRCSRPAHGPWARESASTAEWCHCACTTARTAARSSARHAGSTRARWS